MTTSQIVSEVLNFAPEAVLVGHSGSTSGHPSAARIMRAVRDALPHCWIIYGGVFPTYHWQQIMEQEPETDLVVRGGLWNRVKHSRRCRALYFAMAFSRESAGT